MFGDRRAFRSGESDRLMLHFAVAGAAAGLLVLHEEALPMRLDTQVALCVPKGESRGEARARKRAFVAFTREKSCTLQTFRAQSADISSAAKHLPRFPNWIYRRAANCVAKIREQFCTSATQSIARKVGISPLVRAGAGTRFSAASNSRGRLAKTSHRTPVRPLYGFIVSRSSTSCTCAPRVKLARIAHPFRIPVTQGFSCPTQWTRTAVSSIS